MESTLHRQLKAIYGQQLEVAVAGYRVDAIGPNGELIEVQTGSLSPLRGKLDRLLNDHPVRVIKPIVSRTRVIRRKRLEGVNLSARFSPKRGRPIDIFDDLVGFVRLFPRENLSIEVLTVEVAEIRLPRRRWPGHFVADRELIKLVGEPISLIDAADLWRLLPFVPEGRFSTRDLADWLDCSHDQARRIAYVLRHAGAAQLMGKSGNRVLYAALDGKNASNLVRKESLAR